MAEPDDVAGDCNARLYLGDDYGDNVCTCRCELAPGHDGPHMEQFKRTVGSNEGLVTLAWDLDEREK